MTCAYDKSFKLGDRLLLELISKDIFEGIYVGGGKDRITLSEPVQNNNKLGGLYEFYRNEISDIYCYKLSESKGENGSKENGNKISRQEPNCRLMKVSENEYYYLKEVTKNYIFLENADNRYFKAVEVLSGAETIGVVALGTDNKREGMIELLVLCTWKQVYIFDLANVRNREMYPELKEIFESKYICKVIHKSAPLVDILHRTYKCYMRNIFDTQIVDLMLQKRETSVCPAERDVSECLEHYLYFPKSLLANALGVPNKQWNKRPLSEKTKFYASQLSIYLLELKDNFQKLFMKNVYDTIEKVQDKVYDMDQFEFFSYASKKEVSQDIQDLIPYVAELDVGGEHSKNSDIDDRENTLNQSNGNEM